MTFEPRFESLLSYHDIKPLEIDKLQADASKRIYYRVTTNTNSYIIMDATNDNESHVKFIKVQEILRENGFQVPKILSQDNALLLLQDFGNLHFRKCLNKDNALSYYNLAIDLLIKLAKVKPKDLPIYTKDHFLDEIRIFTTWHLQKTHDELIDLFSSYYDELLQLDPVIALRDFMADNVMYLKDESGINALGLLDFQDAMVGLRLHDLSSILQDARILVEEDVQTQALRYYLTKSNLGITWDKFLRLFHITAAQKNLRIIGVFKRLAHRDNKVHYLSYLPAMFGYVRQNMSNLKELNDLVLKSVNKSMLAPYLVKDN